MVLDAIANGVIVASKRMDSEAIPVKEVREIMWRMPEVDRVIVRIGFGSFTIHPDEICLCDTDSYPCECGTAGQ